MGNFVAHVDEAFVFYILAFWWTYKGFTNHFRAANGGGSFNWQMSYVSKIRGKDVPLEQALKIMFPLTGVIGELFASGFRFKDESEQMAGVKYLMHMSIHGLFVLHGIVDLLVRLKVPWVHPKMDLLTAAMAFFWYGLGLYYHAQKPGNPEIENSLHLFTTKPVLVISVTLLLAIVKPSFFLLDFVRCYCMSLLATWTTHFAFMLYKPGFLGLEFNPHLWVYYPPNIEYVTVAFGMHLIINFIFMLSCYAACYFVMNRRKTKTQNCQYSHRFHEENATEKPTEHDYSSV